MKHSYFQIKEKINQPLRQVPLKLSSEACFSIFLSLCLVFTGLLYSACLDANRVEVASQPAPSSHTLLENHVRTVVSGYPIEVMAPYIALHNKTSAAFLVGIAKKESNWGKRVPVLEDQDCFNYWGYRGIRRMMGTGGHTCFNSRQDAVETVAKRLNTLIHSEELNTPEKMIVWKCGFSCSGHSRESVKKWIADVDMYFSQAGGDE